MPLDTILDRRLLIISGKGGVGKTTVAAALGVLAARHHRKVLIAEVEGKAALPGLFGAGPLSHEPAELRPGLWGMNVVPEEALRGYFEVQFHMKRIARPLLTSQLVYYVTHAAPGLRDILMLGKMWYEATRKAEFDLIVLDTPAAGHTVSMLRSPEGFLHAVPVGPLAGHARKVLEWLKDPAQVAVHLVTMADEMPVNETIETARMLEQQLAVDVAHVYVNMLYPPLADDPDLAERIERLRAAEELLEEASTAGVRMGAKRARALAGAAEFYRVRRGIQQQHRRILVEALRDTAPIVDLPFVFRDRFGAKELEVLADAIEERFSAGAPARV